MCLTVHLQCRQCNKIKTNYAVICSLTLLMMDKYLSETC
jgi:hypothetical protein